MDRQKLAAARLWAAHRHPYLASGLFATTIVAVPGLRGMAVDPAWRLYVDPEAVAAWSVPEIGSVLVHHTGHLLRDHAGRASALGVGEDAAAEWALACDAEVNDDLPAAELELPERPVLPTDLGCEPGRLAEEYFTHLRRERPDRACPDCGSGADGQPRPHDLPGEGVGPGAAHLLRCQVASEILRCARGQMPGTVPAGLLRWAEELLEPRLDWRKVLAAEVRRGIANVAGCVDYSYAHPSRRQSVVRDVVLPSMRKPLPEVAIVCDTSGSMSERLLGRALAEVEGVLRSVGTGRRGVRMLSVDVAVHAVQRVSSARRVELYGGGGTDMGRGLEAAAALRPRPDVVVVLTDGYTPWPAQAPKGLNVVVGLIREDGPGDGRWEGPSWARVVRIEETA